MNSSTAVSRRVNQALANCARKLTDRTKGTLINIRSGSLPRVEKP